MSDVHGRFIWYELMTPEIEAAKTFYGDVVGWTAQDMPMPGGTYTLLQVDGNGVAGVMPMIPELAAQGVPPNWTAYVAVDDCDAAAAKVKALGGQVQREPDDIPGVGRFAVIADPGGAVIAIMTPAPMEGERPQPPAGAPGTTGWHELSSNDMPASRSFYEALFGWKKDGDMDMGPMGTYQLFANQDGQVGGMMNKPEQAPVAAWLYYFRVPDVESARWRVTDGGGQVLNGPMEVPGGDWVFQASDPQGAMFALVGKQKA